MSIHSLSFMRPGGARVTVSMRGSGPRRLYIIRRYPKPDSENQDRWALQWGRNDRRGGYTYETPAVSTHRTKREANEAKRKLEA